tara:strand:+ start:421 stop:912 length:492 start_codon:yes stop_codon:yes gene_type:complete
MAMNCVLLYLLSACASARKMAEPHSPPALTDHTLDLERKVRMEEHEKRLNVRSNCPRVSTPLPLAPSVRHANQCPVATGGAVATQDLSKSLTSIRQDMKRHRLQLLNLEAEREKEQREQDEEAFASADANGDGQLSKAEASSFATLLRKKAERRPHRRPRAGA